LRAAVEAVTNQDDLIENERTQTAGDRVVIRPEAGQKVRIKA
jgi:hypothetical protein